MFVQDLVCTAAARYGNRPAIVEGDRTLAFDDFERRTIRLGNALLDLGLRLGEGSGAVAAVPLVRSASALLREVALLSELGA